MKNGTFLNRWHRRSDLTLSTLRTADNLTGNFKSQG
jgi:hypothetical protein